MGFKEILKSDRFRWFNIFARGILLIIVIVVIDYLTGFKSRWVAFIMGMLVVYISWQFTDFINYLKLRNLKWT